MNRAVEVDVAEFVRADIEVDPIDAIWLVETPVRRGLDLRPCATASATAFNFPVSAGGGAIRPLASRGKVESA